MECSLETWIPWQSRFCHSNIDIIDSAKNIGFVEWLTEASSYPSDEFNKEIIRAFKANGFHGKIEVSYGVRDDGLTQFYELEV